MVQEVLEATNKQTFKELAAFAFQQHVSPHKRRAGATRRYTLLWPLLLKSRKLLKHFASLYTLGKVCLCSSHSSKHMQCYNFLWPADESYPRR